MEAPGLGSLPPSLSSTAGRPSATAKGNGIKTVVMTGVATSGCVESTTRDAFFNEYYTVTVEDCCAEASEVSHNNSLAIVGNTFGLVAKCEDVTRVWQKVEQPIAV